MATATPTKATRKASGSGARKSASKPASAASQNGGARKMIAGAAMRAGAAAAIGFGGRALLNRGRKPRVLGMNMPRKVSPPDLSKIDVKKVAKQVTKAADQVEHASEDVLLASRQVKRFAKRLT